MAWIYRITSSNPGMSLTEMKNNVDEFKNYFNGYMTAAAMAGILGNMQYESFLNPGQQEMGYSGDPGHGFGLIQWTPGSGLDSWCTARNMSWYDGDSQLYRIKCEGERTNGASGYFFAGNLGGVRYSYTWQQFCNLNDNQEACKAYVAERERAGVTRLSERLTYAQNWYNYLVNSVDPPDPGPSPSPPDPRPRDIPFYWGGIRDLMRRGIISNGKL